MFNSKLRSISHLCISEVWKGNPQREALAELVAKFAGKPEFGAILLSLEALDEFAAPGGGAIDRLSFVGVLDIDLEAVELIFTASGARQCETIDEDGYRQRQWVIGSGDAQFTLSVDLLKQTLEGIV